MTSVPSPRPHNRVGSRGRRVFSLVFSLGAPLTWLVIVYLGSLAMLVVSAFYQLDEFTSKSTGQLTWDNISTVVSKSVYRALMVRSIGVALAVTVVCVLVAIPVAFYVSRLAKQWAKRSFIVAMLLPLWTGYLVKAYAIRAVLEPGGDSGGGGLLKSVLGWSPGFGYPAVIMTLAYLWFPYMLLPVYTAIERIPNNMFDASSDLGAGSVRTFRHIVMPILIPAVAAGSIFTFSLSMGDYISVKVVGGTTQMIGNIIERVLLAPNQPLAAAFTLLPVIIMVGYLVAMSRLKAFENL